ncbi:hypothetical protein [Pseudomonas mediterranea]|uniref:hypothetical protein n=1 Tax=Pseudomonas mediterranea TaxID=183795 RepID=UPI0006D88A12|nr:hypothetical protein [Pseudomonas mediterranea]
MSFEGIVQISTVDSEVTVNQFLDSKKGWELLAINVVDHALMYTMGRRAEKKDPLAGLTAGDIARANNL